MVAPNIPAFSLLALGAKFSHTASISQRLGKAITAVRDTVRRRTPMRIDTKNGNAAQATNGSTAASMFAVTSPPGSPKPRTTAANFS